MDTKNVEAVAKEVKQKFAKSLSQAEEIGRAHV